MTRRLALFWLTLLLAALIAVAQPALAAAEDGSGNSGNDNVAVAVNTHDGASIFRFAFHISHVAGDVVDSGNAAVAFSSCNDCQTVAIAIQIVLVTGDPEVVTPENVAIAINQNCTLCETLASAYQFVIGGGEPLRLTPEGIRRIREIVNEIRRLGRSGLSIAEIQARLTELVAELRHVLQTELVPAQGPPRPEEEEEQPPPPESTTTAPETGTTETEPTTSTETSTTETSTGETTTTETTTTTGTTTTGP